jgi:hypothetical protein
MFVYQAVGLKPKVGEGISQFGLEIQTRHQTEAFGKKVV